MRTHRRPRKPPTARDPGWKAAWATSRRAYDEFNRDQGGLMAAAISFYALLSLVPMLLVAVSVAGYFFHSSHDGLTYVLNFTDRLLPSATQLMGDMLAEVVKARGPIGGFGLASLVWSAMQGLVTLEATINLTWGTPSRHWLTSRVFALAMMLVIGVLFLTTIGITSAQAALRGMRGFDWIGHERSVALSGVAISFFISSVMFALIYRYFPTRGSNWRAALEAGGLVALAWEVVKFGYTWYLANLANFGNVYGPLGSLVGLVLWVYYSSFLLVLGSEIAWLRSQTPATAQPARPKAVRPTKK